MWAAVCATAVSISLIFSANVPKISLYWVEQTRKTQKAYSLHAARIDVADHLHSIFFTGDRSCILTSATLSVCRADLNYFSYRVGAAATDAAQIGSCFSTSGK